MKKLIALLASAVLCATVLAGCAVPAAPAPAPEVGSQAQAPKADAPIEGAKDSAQPVTIKWAIFETNNLTAGYWQSIIEAFEKDNPTIKIEKVLMTGDARPQFLRTLLAAGNFPDVIVEAENQIKVKNLLAEVPAELLARYDDATIAVADGKKTVIPAFKQYRMQMYYNKDLFAQAGVAVPKTWDEFIAACETLKAAGIVPMMGAGAKDVWATGSGYWLGAVNSTLIDAYPNFNRDVLDGKVKWANPELTGCLSRWQDMIKAGYYHKGSMSFSYPQAADEFKNGKAAMMLDGSWAAAGHDAAGVSNIGAFPLPNFTGLQTYCTSVSYWGVYQDTKYPEACWKFVDYILGGNEEVYETYLKADGWASVTKEPLDFARGPLMTEFIANYNDMTLVPEITKMVGDDALPVGFEDYLNKSLQNIFNGADITKELNAWDAEFARLLQATQAQ